MSDLVERLRAEVEAAESDGEDMRQVRLQLYAEIKRLRWLLREARDRAEHDLMALGHQRDSETRNDTMADTRDWISRLYTALAGTADQPASRPYAVCELLSDARESVFQDIERMRESGVYEPDLGATIALLHNIDTYLTDRETDQAANCPTCGRSTKRHPGYVIGNHWLESAYERICAGEAEDDVLRDYDVVRVTDQASAAPEAK